MSMITIDETLFKQYFPPRKADAHKGDFGKVLIFAGSTGMAGAAILAGSATVKSGSGLVRFLLPSYQDPIYPILQTSVPEATCITPEKIGFYYYEEQSISGLNEYDAIACGSGLGQDPARINLLRFMIENYSGKLVLDADALNALAYGKISLETMLKSPADIIITPHIGEARRLLAALKATGGALRIKTDEERLKAARLLAGSYQCTVLLKGPGTLIAVPGIKNAGIETRPSSKKTAAARLSSEVSLYKNTTGNPGMATGGSGDVLSGIIASFAGQGLSPEIAAACGAYLHGKAGDIAARELGEASLSAGDLITFLPKAFQ